jgi:hypothetical protein
VVYCYKQVSYLEVYNEVVYDLFSIKKTSKKKDASRRVREHPTEGIFVEVKRTRVF